MSTQSKAKTDAIMEYLQKSINDHDLRPGDRLPSERKLSEMLNVSRACVRQSLQKLELYGIVKTFPQSGTVVSSFNKQQLDMLISNALTIGRYDFRSLVEVRVILESEALRLCALNHTDEDLQALLSAQQKCVEYFTTDRRIETDLNFHIALSRGAHNSVITSLLLSIIPDTFRYYEKFNFCKSPEQKVINEHNDMIEFVSQRSTDNPRPLVETHLQSQIELSQRLDIEQPQAPKAIADNATDAAKSAQ
jgi:GntR family transcriptional repressor for pyruvate dehydrogenase complex